MKGIVEAALVEFSRDGDDDFLLLRPILLWPTLLRPALPGQTLLRATLLRPNTT